MFCGYFNTLESVLDRRDYLKNNLPNGKKINFFIDRVQLNKGL